MATMQDYDIIEAICNAKKEAKSKKENLPKKLSDGKKYYKKAINSIRNAAAWTTATLLFCWFVISALTLIPAIVSGNFVLEVAIGDTILLALILVPVILSSKVYSLKVTPTFILVTLIINIIFSICFFPGILPLIGVIFDIIALTRWSTYKDWFYNAAQKNPKTKLTPQQKLALNYMPRHGHTGFIVAIVLLTALAIAGPIGMFFWAKGFGWEEGRNSAKDEYYNYGYGIGYDQGRKDGWSSGYSSGKSDARWNCNNQYYYYW